jgi:hypothetical protein
MLELAVLMPVEVEVDSALILEFAVLMPVEVEVDSALMLDLAVLIPVEVEVDKALMLESAVLMLVDVEVDSALMLASAVLIPVDVEVESALMLEFAVLMPVDVEVDNALMQLPVVGKSLKVAQAAARDVVGSVASVRVADASRKVAGVEATQTAPHEANSPCSNLLRLCTATRCRICTAGSSTRAAR